MNLSILDDNLNESLGKEVQIADLKKQIADLKTENIKLKTDIEYFRGFLVDKRQPTGMSTVDMTRSICNIVCSDNETPTDNVHHLCNPHWLIMLNVQSIYIKLTSIKGLKRKILSWLLK